MHGATKETANIVRLCLFLYFMLRFFFAVKNVINTKLLHCKSKKRTLGKRIIIHIIFYMDVGGNKIISLYCVFLYCVLPTQCVDSKMLPANWDPNTIIKSRNCLKSCL